MTGPLGTSLGVGVDENTALVIYDVGETSQLGEVLGASGVLFVDLSKSTVSTVRNQWAINNVISSYLTDGDTYAFNGNKVNFATWKLNLQGREYYNDAITSNDIFCNPDKVIRNNREFAKVTRRLYDNRRDVTTYGDTDENLPRFRVNVDKSVGGSYGFGGYHAVNGNFYVSFTGLDTDIAAT
ncbi:cyanophycinase-like [Amphiura filiformis]|uniref:cyanophycinase-like n=1 Tax=Amphiura filiformis TaxID=82378 RepID=UPI003B2225B7